MELGLVRTCSKTKRNALRAQEESRKSSTGEGDQLADANGTVQGAELNVVACAAIIHTRSPRKRGVASNWGRGPIGIAARDG